VVEIFGDGWESGPVLVAERFAERLRGLRGRGVETSMLIRGWTVHGFGIRRSCVVVALDESFRVLSSQILRPRRVVVAPGAAFMLELPASASPPALDSPLRHRLIADR
jgi:hypothetical protein